jgi:hypothetical protein
MGGWINPLRTFYSAALYRDLARRRTGTGLLYLWMLVACVWTIQALRLWFTFQQGLAADGGLRAFIDQMPAITINQGIVSADVEQPYRWSDPSDPSFVLVIDTTGATNVDDLDKGVLLTESQLHVKRSAYETRTFELREVEHFSVDSTRLMGWARPLQVVLMLATAVGMTLVIGLYRTVLALGLAGYALLLGRAFQVPLDFQAGLRCATAAMTPAILGAFVAGLLGFGAGCIWMFAWGACNLGFTTFAVLANRTGDPVSTER